MRIFIILLIWMTGFIFSSFYYLPGKAPRAIDALPEYDSIPLLNKQIIDFVNSNIRKKVGRGECWDLAAEALNLTGAKWNGKFEYGKEVNYKKDCIFPGDMIQFEGVAVKYVINKITYKETMAQHTAIVYEVKGKGDFILADQNTSSSGRKVGLHPLDLKNITKGKFKIYRPAQ